jgi:hypothetical protein
MRLFLDLTRCFLMCFLVAASTMRTARGDPPPSSRPTDRRDFAAALGEARETPAEMVDDAQLRELLRVIDTTPSTADAFAFNPRRLIHVVNTLQPLGKEKALTAISEYLRVTPYPAAWGSGRNGVFLLMRTLFEVPDDPGYLPRANLGRPSPGVPADLKSVPRFPLTIVDDVPFLLTHGYSAAGPSPRPELELPYFRDHAQIRAKPLVPPDNPLGLYAKVLKISDTLENSVPEHGLLAMQVFSLLDSVYRMPDDPMKESVETVGDVLEHMQRLTGRLDLLRADPGMQNIRWDRQNNRYVFAKDGTFLPEPVTKVYLREVWNTVLFGRPTQVIAERRSEKQVHISLQYQTQPESRRFSLRVYAWDPARPNIVIVAVDKMVDTPLASELRVPPVVPPVQSAILGVAVDAECPEGWQAQLELQVGEVKSRNNAWTP